MTDFQAKDPNFESRVRNAFHLQGFMVFLGASISRLEAGFCEIELDYRKELTQQNGYFHGGIIGTLADNACGFASYTLMDENDAVLTVEYKLNLIAPGDGEKLVARGIVIKPGRTLTVCQADVFAVRDGIEKLCATSLTTMFNMAG